MLRQYGVSVGDTAAVAESFAATATPEPADWPHRLSQRGAGDDPVDSLLAIARTAECQAYRLLEHMGIPCAQLRKAIVDERRTTTRRRRPPATGAPGPAAPHHTPPRRQSSLRGEEPRPRTSPSPRRATAAAPAPSRRRQSDPAPNRELQPEAEPEPREESAPRTLQAVSSSALPGLHGRAATTASLADALNRQMRRAPLLVADHGSGRSAVALSVAGLIECPTFWLRAPDYDDEQALRDDLQAIAEAGGIAVFDDLDRMGTDTPPAFLTALAQAWATARPPVLTVVSPETRARLGQWMPGVLETLDVLTLDPLGPDDALVAFKLAGPAVLEAHGMQLDSTVTLTEIHRVADRFLTGMAMPGRSLDLLDLACARSRRLNPGRDAALGREMVIDVVHERTGISRSRIAGTSEHDALDLDASLARQVVGHERAIHTTCQLIRRNRAGFSGQRPIASVLLLGPSGVGKTEIAKALAGALYEREDALLRLDMSEYSEAHAVARIVGAPPGYVGHEQGGALTDPMLQNPHRVVLLDEIEKAHRDVHQLLLQVLDEGRLTDGRGRTIDFRHAVLMMTSNLGAGLLQDESTDDVVLDDVVLDEARSAFPVELWNRIEAPLVLRPLSRDQMRTICERMVARSSERLLAERGVRFTLHPSMFEALLDAAGNDPALGARPLRHLLAREVESVVAEAVLRGQLRAGQAAEIQWDDGDVVIRRAR